MPPQPLKSQNRILVYWLSLVCATVYVVLVVGGITRLTHSGLSMVAWQPVMGVIPPLGAADWQDVFEAYQAYPEYQKINQGMSLETFKSIYYWEYGHRLLGRILSVIFLIPFVVLLIKRRIPRRWLPRLCFAFVLGGIQGLVGWYMVKSGLVDIPAVSHYRLALHLLLALFIMAYLLWLIFDIRGLAQQRRPIRGSFSGLVLLVVALLSLQILVGAFAAGLKAGHGFNTYPLMHGQWLADAALMMTPAWMNLVENGVMLQFVHRWLGALLVATVLWLALWSMRHGLLVKPGLSLLAITLVQFLLGILTLVYQVPILLASLHQFFGTLMVLIATYLLYMTRPPAILGLARESSH